MEIFTLKTSTLGIFIATIIASVVAWFILYASTSDNSQISDNSTKLITNKSNLVKEKSINTAKAIVQMTNCKNIAPPPLANKSIKSLENIEEQAQRVLVAELYNPKNLIENAGKGDPLSALAAFSLFQSCFPTGEVTMLRNSAERKIGNPTLEFCEDFPEHVRSDPLSLLEVAATKGSAEVKLVYAMNAEHITKLAVFLAKRDAPVDSVTIMKKAELFGANAANNGIEEAYWFMARAYQMGTFREPDPIRAYAYTLPLTTINQSSELSDRLELLDKNLSSAQIKQAETMAWGCNHVDITNAYLLVNPFGK